VKRAAPLLLALLAAFAFALSRGTETYPARPVDPSSAAPVAPSVSPQVPLELPRDPFQFGVPRPESPLPGPAVVGPPPPEAGPPGLAGAPVRLIGFVQQGGRLRAALVVDGETVLLAVGDLSGGYTVLAADETTGVRLRGPAGEELALEVPE